ncbi:SdpI family protein, partial [Patescibacteria group bacterium]|nr:SdpI family protein [Patescibacteria group bacterium]
MKIINSAIIVLMFIVGLVLFPMLPDTIPIHWNVFGQVDNYMPKNPAVWFIPILTLLMFVSFQIFPHFDPKKDKYKLFKQEWKIMQAGLVGFMAYLQFTILYITLHPSVPMMPMMFIGLGALFILMGNYMSKIRQNYFIGMKLPWTLANEDNWNKTHRFASWCFVGAGILTLAEAYFIWFAPVVIFGSIFLALALPIIYSFLLFKKA